EHSDAAQRARRMIESRLVGNGPAIRRIRELVAKIAASTVEVLLVGETGTGKGVVARCLHDLGRPGMPYLERNLGVYTGDLASTQLFGYEPRSFTGAQERGPRIGVFEAARGGTLLMDEIEALPMETQAKLLQVLQTGVFQRLGGHRDLTTDARIIAA